MAFSSSFVGFIGLVSVISEIVEFVAAVVKLMGAGLYFVGMVVIELGRLYCESRQTMGSWDSGVELESEAVWAELEAVEVEQPKAVVGGVGPVVGSAGGLVVRCSSAVCTVVCSSCPVAAGCGVSASELSAAGCSLVTAKNGRKLGGAVLAGRVRKLAESGELVLG
jgi:hypothetical protein